MIKILPTVAVLGSVGSLAGLAMAQGKQGEGVGSDVSSLLAKLEAQCAHRRRTMPPDPRDGCDLKLRSDARRAPLAGASANGQTGPGNAVGPKRGRAWEWERTWSGIGPGSGRDKEKAGDRNRCCQRSDVRAGFPVVNETPDARVIHGLARPTPYSGAFSPRENGPAAL